MKNAENCFYSKFGFLPSRSLMVGVERESFLADSSGRITPLAVSVLDFLKQQSQNGKFGYELSACQLETRVGSCRLPDLKVKLAEVEAQVKKAEQVLNFKCLEMEVAPDDMPLDIYPDPFGRYQEIVKKMPPEVLLAACQVVGTHVHIGLPDHKTALKVYNQAVNYCDELCQLGDGSCGQRLALYKKVAPNFQPPSYASWQDYFEYAEQHSFADNPRNCWHLIRLSIHGTIEFRMFGTTGDLNKIVTWANKCWHLCWQAIVS